MYIIFFLNKELLNQRAHPNTFTTQIRDEESHFTVTVPST